MEQKRADCGPDGEVEREQYVAASVIPEKVSSMLNSRVTMDSRRRIIDIDEICTWLKLKKSYIYHLTHIEAIPHIKLSSNTLRFDVGDIVDWLESKKVVGAGRK
ncbi:helix-turn-helix transcriptional regulator [Acidobacteriota bacterium]